MDQRRTTVAAGVVGLLCFAVRLGEQWDPAVSQGGALPWWLPRFGTIGETIVLYRYVLEILAGLAPVGLGIALGVVVGRRIDLPVAYRRFVASVLLGSTVGATAGVVTVAAAYGSAALPSPDAFGLLVVLLVVGLLFVTIALPIAAGALAGAALAHFEAIDDARYRPADADARISDADA